MRCYVLPILGLLSSVPAYPQAPGGAARGRTVFRSNCAFCHGLTGTGGRGPNLVASRVVREDTDERLAALIRKGVPGTTMPAFRFEEDEMSSLIAFLRGIAGSGTGDETVAGDPAAGRRVYERSGCVACHRIGEEGMVFGPDLSRIGSGRSVAYLRESVVKPSADIPQEFEAVTVVTRDGNQISGIRINEDTFSIQLRDASGQFRMFVKDEVRQVIDDRKSLMPAYDKLPASDLENLVAYLHSLRHAPARGDVKNAEVPR